MMRNQIKNFLFALALVAAAALGPVRMFAQNIAGGTVSGTTVTATTSLTSPILAVTDTTNQVALGTTNVTTISAAAPASSITVQFPNVAGSIPTAFDCGSTGSGNQTCSPAAASGNYHAYSGRSTLSGSTATITFPIAFGASTSFTCVANDVTTRANPVQMVPASTTTATITNTTGASDVIQWWCGGI